MSLASRFLKSGNGRTHSEEKQKEEEEEEEEEGSVGGEIERRAVV